MVVKYNPPADIVCLRCGGKVGFVDMEEEGVWALDQKNHVCQDPPDLEAVAKARSELPPYWEELEKFYS